MAINLDLNLLDELGLGALPETEKGSLLNHIYDTLEMRVGMRLADRMSNEQLEEFEKYFEAKDDAGAFRWLETNFPNYKEIVQEEFNKLKAEVRQTAPQILQASVAAQAGTSPTQAQPLSANSAGATPLPSPLAPPLSQPYPPQPSPYTDAGYPPPVPPPQPPQQSPPPAQP